MSRQELSLDGYFGLNFAATSSSVLLRFYLVDQFRNLKLHSLVLNRVGNCV